jgi:hypothetical protein
MENIYWRQGPKPALPFFEYLIHNFRPWKKTTTAFRLTFSISNLCIVATIVRLSVAVFYFCVPMNSAT